MVQYNFLALIIIFLIYFIILCIRKRISLFSTFFTLAFGVALFFSINTSNTPNNMAGLYALIDIAIFISLLFMIIFCRSLYWKKEKKDKSEALYEQILEENPETINEIEETPIQEAPIIEEKRVEEASIIQETPVVEKVKEEVVIDEKETLTLKDAIKLAKNEQSSLNINKATIYDYLSKYEDVELNTRNNITSTGLPLADTHYRLVDDSKVCFAYVYEIENKSFMILRLPQKEEIIGYIRKFSLKKSAFPKQACDWYTVIISNKFKSNEEIFALLDEAYNQVEYKNN